MGDDMKYILVSGGVISGIGKGVFTSSVGTLLKASGLSVSAIKIDPYLNIDAGTFSPYEHGEVFVLDDGGEVDLDLGNYERFLDITLHRDNNITTGKIYSHVIQKERKGDYLGKTVQVVPHVTDAIIEWVQQVARKPVDDSGRTPQVCVIELGGTIGDIEGMPFIEAFRQFQFRIGASNFCNIHLSLVPEPQNIGEQKTKPTQNSVRQLRSQGLTPDLIVCRSKNKLTESSKEKLSNFCHVPKELVISVPDCPSIYQVPLLLHKQKVLDHLSKKLQLPSPASPSMSMLKKWKHLSARYDTVTQGVKIVLVGKYTRLEDAYISVTKALRHAALGIRKKLILSYVEAENLEVSKLAEEPVEYHKAWQTLAEAEGVLIPGGFGNRGIEGKVAAARYCRERKVPMLGVCLGMQVAVIEFARNVLGWEDANSTEFNPDTKHPVVIDMPEHHPGDMGGTMRLGKRRTVFKDKDCLTRKLYKNVDYVEERHRHRYEINPDIVQELEKYGLKFVGHDESQVRMEIMELQDHPYFIATQFHPEYLTRPLHHSPPYMGLILAASGKLQQYLDRGCQVSPSSVYQTAEEEDDYDDEVTQAMMPEALFEEKLKQVKVSAPDESI